MARCEDCTLFTEESRYCPSDGPAQADVVVVGEAPGFKEAQEGKPFSGPSGRLLDSVLVHHGIDRSKAFVTNVCLCRPKDNRTPTKSEIACCASRLEAEVHMARPRTIIALGNTASQAILNTSEGITRTRVGPPKHSDKYDCEVIPTFHPAACLRAADFFPALVSDIGKVERARITFDPPTFRVFDEEATAEQALRELQRSHHSFVVDIEVGIDKDTDFDHPDRYQMLCIGISYAPGRAIVVGERALQGSGVRNLFRRYVEGGHIIAHNGKFDLAGIQAYLGDKVGRVYFDTMLASYVEDERPGVHGLKYLASEALGAPDYAADLSRYVDRGGNYATAPRDVLYRYNAYDVACTWLLYEKYSQEFTAEQLKLHDFLVEAGNALMYSEVEGVTVDPNHLNHLTDHYLEGLDTLEADLRQWVGNPRSPQQVKAALGEFGYNVQSTDAETLHNLQDRATSNKDLQRFLELMLLHRREQKLYGTYVKGIRKRMYKGRVYPTFLLHGTTTGRLACRNPNLQNVPRESVIRQMFVPAEGNVFIQGDYAQAELRVIATLARDEYLRSVFADPTRDIHGEVATRFYGDGWTKEQRVRAKAVVFGLAYGREAYSLAQEFKIPVAEAQKYLAEFFSMMPGVVAWRESIKQQILHEQEDLVSHFGRHRRFWLITEENRVDVVKEGLAFLPQSTASDICLSALIELRQLGLAVRLPVHDSILVECARSEADDVAHTMRRVMEEAAVKTFTDYVKFPVDIAIGQSWGELS